MKNFKSFLKEFQMSDLDISKQELGSILKQKYKIDLDAFQDQLLGGVADNISLEAILRIPKKELLKGIEVEFEHTSDPYKAFEIALDHLLENPPESYKYYIGLEKMENDLGM